MNEVRAAKKILYGKPKKREREREIGIPKEWYGEWFQDNGKEKKDGEGSQKIEEDSKAYPAVDMEKIIMRRRNKYFIQKNA